MAWKVRAYYNVNPFIGVSRHDTMVTIPLPPFMIPGKLPHIDFDVVQGLWMGCFLSTGRGRKIVSDDLLFVGRMSDAGFIVPHISIPPSWYNLLTTLFGSSTTLFGASGVTIACKNLLWGNQDCDLATSPFPVAPVSLNLACWDPASLPTDIVVLWGTVYAGMSLADLVSALIDLAIQWAMEGLMWLGGKALQAGFKKLGKKAASAASKGAAKRAAAKGAKKGIFATAGEKIVTAFKKATGATASDAYKSYLKKAADCKGLKSALSMSDDELAAFVKKTGGFSDELSGVAENFTEGYSKFGSKYGKQVKGLDRTVIDGASKVRYLKTAVKNLGDGLVTDESVSYLAKNTLLKDSLKELDAAIAKVASEEFVWQIELKLAQKSISKLYTMIVRSGNAFGSGTDGGIFSFQGAGWTNNFARTMQFKDKWSWNLANDIAGTSASEIYGEEYDDYWYLSASDATTGAAAKATLSSDDDDDDYWYDSDSSDSSTPTSAV